MQGEQQGALLPCPFCGHVGLMFSEGSTFRWRIAECERCGATTGEERMQTTGEGTRKEWIEECDKRLIAAWNRRAPRTVEVQLLSDEDVMQSFVASGKSFGVYRENVQRAFLDSIKEKLLESGVAVVIKESAP